MNFNWLCKHIEKIRSSQDFLANFYTELKGCLYEKRRPGYSQVNQVLRLPGIILIFIDMRSFTRFAGMKMLRGIVLSLVRLILVTVQFYCIPAFIFGLLASIPSSLLGVRIYFHTNRFWFFNRRPLFARWDLA